MRVIGNTDNNGSVSGGAFWLMPPLPDAVSIIPMKSALLARAKTTIYRSIRPASAKYLAYLSRDGDAKRRCPAPAGHHEL